jgi:hypothetical protein
LAGPLDQVVDRRDDDRRAVVEDHLEAVDEVLLLAPRHRRRLGSRRGDESLERGIRRARRWPPLTSPCRVAERHGGSSLLAGPFPCTTPRARPGGQARRHMKDEAPCCPEHDYPARSVWRLTYGRRVARPSFPRSMWTFRSASPRGGLLAPICSRRDGRMAIAASAPQISSMSSAQNFEQPSEPRKRSASRPAATAATAPTRGTDPSASSVPSKTPARPTPFCSNVTRRAGSRTAGPPGRLPRRTRPGPTFLPRWYPRLLQAAGSPGGPGASTSGETRTRTGCAEQQEPPGGGSVSVLVAPRDIAGNPIRPSARHLRLAFGPR